jgi:ligand-binding sensor domain-containing protein
MPVPANTLSHARKIFVHRLALFAYRLTVILLPALLCLPGFALNPNRSISQYSHATWRMQEGFFNGRATVVAQTTDGYLWIGTHNGLLRFDGVRFMPWTPPLGTRLPQDDIRALRGAHDGSLWIGTRDGLFHWKGQKLVHISGISGSVIAIVEDRQGDIWVARGGPGDPQGVLCQIVDDKAQCFNQNNGLPAGISDGQSLLVDPGGDLWMGANRLLVRWRGGSPSLYTPPGLASNSNVGIDALAASPDGSMWVGLDEPGRGLGLERLVDGNWAPFPAPELDGSKLQVTDLFSDRDGALWIGTADQGIYHYYNGRVDQFRMTDGLSSDFISTFFQDNEGTVWVVTPQGVDSFHDINVTTWSAREGLTTDNVVSVAASHDGTVWVGNAGGLDSIKNGKISSIREGKGLPGNQVRSVFEDQENRLWVGVDNDLTLYQGGHFKKISRLDGSSIGPVSSITEDPQKNLWVESVQNKKLLRIRDLKIQEEFPLSDIDPTRALAADAQGNLWLGLREGGLARFQNGHVEKIHFPHSMNSRVRQMIVNPDGSIFAASSSGILAWKEGRTFVLGTRNGLPCDGINGMIGDEHSNLWLHASCGVIEIDQSELQQWWKHPANTVQFRFFDMLDGTQPGNAFYEPAARSKDGLLWFANGSVLQMVDPSNLIRNPVPPPVHVEEIIADRKHYSPQGIMRLPRLTRDLEIDYTALSFVAPQKMRFRYRLDGHDKDWQEAGTRRQAFYTDLSPGNYRFRVLACNNDGVWNESGATLSFFIVPAFYQTSWFHILCVIAVGSLFCIFYLAHLKRVTRRIQEQLATRLEERERIARELHDTLLQGFQGLMLRFQSVLKNIPSEGPARQMMEGALDRADKVLLEGRQRVHDLREGGINGDGLWNDLALWGEELALDRSTRFSATIIGTPQPLTPAASNEVYQIGREALTNAFRHAFADRIEIEITYDHLKVRLIIRDDGKGMDNEILKRGRSGHWGLSGMRERAQKIGAQLNIWSHGGAGTEIDLSIPARLAYQRPRKKFGWHELKQRVMGRPEQESS